jgi:hypothetical protein
MRASSDVAKKNGPARAGALRPPCLSIPQGSATASVIRQSYSAMPRCSILTTCQNFLPRGLRSRCAISQVPMLPSGQTGRDNPSLTAALPPSKHICDQPRTPSRAFRRVAYFESARGPIRSRYKQGPPELMFLKLAPGHKGNLLPRITARYPAFIGD